LRVAEVAIRGAEAVAKSYPSFWEEFARLTEQSQRMRVH
jgi:5-enolpyruvylshikimate-3-phosphate synthase